MNADWKYQTDKVALVPYTRQLADLYDGLLGHLYLRTKEDGLLDTAFPGLPGINMDKFVSYLADPKVALQVYYIKGRERNSATMELLPVAPMTPVGYCFLYNINGDDGGRLAEFGFCFFREYWGRPEVHELGWQCLRYWCEEMKVDVLYGTTLKNNFLARNFSRKFGFEEIAVLPKFLRSVKGRKDARLVLLEREMFMARWRAREAREQERQAA